MSRQASSSFPRLQARSHRFSLGVPRSITVTAGGARVLFIRTADGTSTSGQLWSYDVETGDERCLVDPAALLGDAQEELSAEERSRRERSREAGSGIVGYTSDDAGMTIAFSLSGQLWVHDTESGDSRALPSLGAVIDPRIDPSGRHIAYASDGALRIIGADGALDHVLVEPDASSGGTVVWGQAEFVAAEEMDRYNGYWWSPTGDSLLVERFDNAPVALWYVADPANPDSEPVAHRYPAAGTDNADVTLWHVTLDGTRVRIDWDVDPFPYLTRVSWTSGGDPLAQVMSRDQRRSQVLSIDVETGTTTLQRDLSDPVWIDLVIGSPAYAPGGALVTVEDTDDTKKVFVDGKPVSPTDLQVRSVLSIDDDGVLVSASSEPTEVHLHRIALDGTVTDLTHGEAVHVGAAGSGVLVVSRSALDAVPPTISVLRGTETIGRLSVNQADPGFRPDVALLRAGEHEIRTAVLFPTDHVRGSGPLPVLLDPYGGPHAQRVLATARVFLESQWLADQGFCVVVADGRGTPARGPVWDRAVRDELIAVTLHDQVEALDAVAAAYPDDVDTTRVGITGWSYGGYLAAAAVILRPDVFHAAVAGAPVTEQRLYDTFYSERYLGHPDEQPDVYDRNSLTGQIDPDVELPPLLIIHGMVDDNVVVAHSLRLSSALLAAGKPHSVLPLTGITHMAADDVVAENLQLLQVDFLKKALAH